MNGFRNRLARIIRPETGKDISNLVFSGFGSVADYKVNWKPVYWALGIYAVVLIIFLSVF